MLTINADGHALMQQFHKPTDEKRMVVVLPKERYSDWLQATEKTSREYMQNFPVELCVRAEAVAERQSSLLM
jgi:putative SOS response-associated peptidase YedK